MEVAGVADRAGISGGGRGRHPYPLETMLRVHLMQNWFGLSDPAMEEALYEIAPMRVFAGLSLTKAMPDETTILNFRHLLEEYELAPEILSRVNAYLTRKGLMLKREASWTRRSSRRRARRRTRTASAIRKCTRRRRATSGTSA